MPSLKHLPGWLGLVWLVPLGISSSCTIFPSLSRSTDSFLLPFQTLFPYFNPFKIFSTQSTPFPLLSTLPPRHSTPHHSTPQQQRHCPCLMSLVRYGHHHYLRRLKSLFMPVTPRGFYYSEILEHVKTLDR